MAALPRVRDKLLVAILAESGLFSRVQSLCAGVVL
jgi:hypothetical protein